MNDKKVVTNGDRIRAMTDEELAEAITKSIICLGCPILGDCYGKEPADCKVALLTWLRSPVEESEK